MSAAGRPLGEGRGGGEAPKPEPNEERFECTGDGCVVIERATEMFNTSCDPATVTVEELRTKALCMSCAVRYARRRGKHVAVSSVDDDGIPRYSRRDITAAGSGLYPLSQTLRAMRSGAATTGIVSPENVYTCMESGCTTVGPAQDMFNRPCDMGSTGMRELLALICCRAHAEEIAAKRGMRPGEAGSGVYVLSVTLRRIQVRVGAAAPAGPSVRERHEQSYLQWYLHRPISRYAALLAAGDGGGLRLPAPNVAADGSHLCGLPIDCCDHQVPVDRYLRIDGETVGICALAAQVFADTSDGMDHGDKRRHRIFPTDSPERAALAASHSLGEHETARDPECPACARSKSRRP